MAAPDRPAVLDYAPQPQERRPVYSLRVAVWGGAATAVVVVLLVLIVSRFGGIASDFGLVFPAVIQFVLDLSTFLARGWWAMLFAPALLLPFIGPLGRRAERKAIILILILFLTCMVLIGTALLMAMAAMVGAIQSL